MKTYTCTSCGESYESPQCLTVNNCVMCGGNLLGQSELNLGFESVTTKEPIANNTLFNFAETKAAKTENVKKPKPCKFTKSFLNVLDNEHKQTSLFREETGR